MCIIQVSNKIEPIIIMIVACLRANMKQESELHGMRMPESRIFQQIILVLCTFVKWKCFTTELHSIEEF